jgi:flagellar biogenesis protein FliO
MSQEETDKESQSGMKVLLAVIGFMIGVILLVLAVKYLFGL